MKRVRAGKHLIAITAADKILFPESNLTKADLVSYYQRITPFMLPHVKNRLLTMHRFPHGISAEGFYQKDAPDYFPDFITRMPLSKKDGGIVRYIVCNNEATLVYLAQQLCIVMHRWLSTVDKIMMPDRLVFDLDPSDCSFAVVQKVARIIKKHLELLGLSPFVMSTGSRGLHVVVPLHRVHTFDEVRAWARDVAEELEQKHPEFITTNIRKAKRGTRIFIDVLRNAYAQTAVAPYSVRARPGAPVAVPLRWKEALSTRMTPNKYTIKNVFRRLARVGDLWADMDKHACNLPELDKISF